MRKTINKTPEAIEVAENAIAYVLKRIKQDENIRAHMGPFTEAFNRLKRAHSLLTGESENEIESEIVEYQLPHKSNYTKIHEIRDVVDDLCDGAPDASAIAKLANQIAKICRD